MAESLKWYFAYGSNMNTDRMAKRKVPYEDLVPGILKGWKLVFNKKAQNKSGEGYANIVPCADDTVEGVLYLTTERGLKDLDSFEGVSGGHYRRVEIQVLNRKTGETCLATVYLAVDGKVADGLKPSVTYLSHLLAGRDLLSEEYYQRLTSVKTID